MSTRHSDAFIALGVIILLAALVISKIAAASECGLISSSDLRRRCYSAAKP